MALLGTLYSNINSCQTFQHVSYTFDETALLTSDNADCSADRIIIISSCNKYISLIFDLNGIVVDSSSLRGGIAVYPSPNNNNNLVLLVIV